MPRPKDENAELAITEFRGEYSFLSNFHHSPIMMSDIEFPTVEHAYQASKTLDIEIRERIAMEPNPGKVKQMGRVLQLRDDWEDVKELYMLTLVQAKFNRYADLAVKLLDTYPSELIEGNYWNDKFWGMVKIEDKGINGWVGYNKLGQILMRVRQELMDDGA